VVLELLDLVDFIFSTKLGYGALGSKQSLLCGELPLIRSLVAVWLGGFSQLTSASFHGTIG
jgi:hypothetical protein